MRTGFRDVNETISFETDTETIRNYSEDFSISDCIHRVLIVYVGISVNYSHYKYRGNCYKLFVEQTSSNCLYHFFASRVIPVWNSLPSNFVNFSTLPKFKTSLFLVDLSKI